MKEWHDRITSKHRGCIYIHNVRSFLASNASVRTNFRERPDTPVESEV